MNIYDKSRIKLFKINGICVVIKYNERISDSYELYFEGEVSSAHPKLYIYNTGNEYIFGKYVEYRNAFTDLTHLNIHQQIFNFMLERMTNANKLCI